MKIYVGVTDYKWFKFLRELSLQPPSSASLKDSPGLDEVNFWQPSPAAQFRAIGEGDLFLFKPHRQQASGEDLITGGGVFYRYLELPISLAWETFGKKNGCRSYAELREAILRYRSSSPAARAEDFKIGCVILTQPFFLDEADWFSLPGWRTSIVRGKTYSLDSQDGQYLWQKVMEVWQRENVSDLLSEGQRVMAEQERYGQETTIRPRLGQGTFRVAVTEAYRRSCAVTGEHSLPALEAAHIKPYGDSGPHAVSNGLLLRSDLHRLFDRGYVTVTTDYHIEVSPRLKEEYRNGRSYYPFHGRKLDHLPPDLADHPSRDYLLWHNENVFRE